MLINHLDKPQGSDDFLQNIPSPDNQNITFCVDQLLDILNQFPNLLHETQSAKKINLLIEKIFSRKEHLSSDRQKAISKLFYAQHGLWPNRYEMDKLSELEIPVQVWITSHLEAKAIIEGKQKFPVPVEVLRKENITCKEFFKSLSVQLIDKKVEISQGLLAHFSEMVHSMMHHKEMKNDLNLVLDQLNSHQFDTLIAYLESHEPALINEENVLPLFYAANYLQIPLLIEGCEKFIIDHVNALSLTQSVDLLNHFGQNNVNAKLFESHISKILASNLCKPISEEFSEEMAYLNKHLTWPIALSLGHTDIEDSALKLLQGLPISHLQLFQCKKLTKECLPILSSIPTIKILHLGANDWVDDEALAKIPTHVEELILAGCRIFTGKGLAALHSGIKTLNLMGCKHLSDNNYIQLPLHFENINFSSTKGIDIETMKHLGKMKQLHHLVLTNTLIKDDQIALLPLQLHTLNLAGCSITHKTCLHLGLMENLEKLTIAHSKIGDKEIALLPLSLIHLKLEDCPELTDKGILFLNRLKKLTFLEIFRCNKVSNTSLGKLSSQIKLTKDKQPLSNLITQPSK